MRRRLDVCSGLLISLLTLAPAATSQLIGQSSKFQLAGLSLDGAGGGQCSPGYSLWLAVGEISDGELTSLDFKAGLGFLEASDPEPTNAPIVFGLRPGSGPKAGGTELTIAGLNFDKFGTGASVQIGGSLAAGTVISNTQIIVTTPPGIHGPQSLAVTNPFGTASDPDAFIYTPAVVTTPIAPLGSDLVVRNYGPAGDSFWTLFSTSTQVLSTHYGTLLIGGAAPLRTLLMGVPYPSPFGLHQFTLTVPNTAALQGLTFSFQSVWFAQDGSLQGQLTNMSQSAIP